MPLFFLGGEFRFALAPGRQDVTNPFLLDEFNQVTGAAAFGLRQSLDFHLIDDRHRKARSDYHQALHQRELAESAILADVRGRFQAAQKTEKRIRAAAKGLRAARSWVSAEMSNYDFGLTETQEVLEAFIAFAKTKIEYIDTVFKFNTALAELSRLTARENMPLEYSRPRPGE